MLSINYFFLISLFVHYFILYYLFILFFKNNQLIFIKIWYVFFFFIIQNLLLGFFGEDFFIILIIVSELPIFFCFFFFYISKSQLNYKFIKSNYKFTKFFIFIPITLYIVWFQSLNNYSINTFTYFFFNILTFLPQKSDFFIYFLNYFLISYTIIILIGILITMITFILLIFTFKNQIQAINNIIDIKHISWIRTQDTSIQNNHLRVFTFFKI